MLELVSDILLAAGALGAAAYCAVLARKLSRFTDLEKGMGGAIAVLSVQVDELTKALSEAQVSAGQSHSDLAALTARAGEASKHLEIMMAALHDIPQPAPIRQQPQPSFATSASAPQWRPGSKITPVEPTRSAATDDAAPQWQRRHSLGRVGK